MNPAGILSYAWGIGQHPYVRAGASVFFLVLAALALAQGDGGPLARRIAAEAVATVAGGINATLAIPAYFLTNLYLVAQS